MDGTEETGGLTMPLETPGVPTYPGPSWHQGCLSTVQRLWNGARCKFTAPNGRVDGDQTQQPFRGRPQTDRECYRFARAARLVSDDECLSLSKLC